MANEKREKSAFVFTLITCIAVMIVFEIIILKFIQIMILKIIMMILLPIISFKPLMMIGGFLYFRKTHQQDSFTDIKNYDHGQMTFDKILLYNKKLISSYGAEEFLNMICSKGFQFIDASEELKEYFGVMLRNLSKIEMTKALQFCGFSYYCFKYFIWLEEKTISEIYSKEQLIEKIKQLSHDSLYLKTKIIDPIQIISPEMNLDVLYTASTEPDLIQFISINMLDQGMMQFIPDKQKIIDIIIINHIFINILGGEGKRRGD
jgi:hypothetical protein